MKSLILLKISLVLTSCVTSFIEFKGECVIQDWKLAGINTRTRILCDFPPPTLDEGYLRDRDAMEVNPFPDLFDFNNKADTIDPNLLEKTMGVPQEE